MFSVKNEESLSKLNVKRLGTPTKTKLEAINSGTALEVVLILFSDTSLIGEFKEVLL